MVNNVLLAASSSMKVSQWVSDDLVRHILPEVPAEILRAVLVNLVKICPYQVFEATRIFDFAGLNQIFIRLP